MGSNERFDLQARLDPLAGVEQPLDLDDALIDPLVLGRVAVGVDLPAELLGQKAVFRTILDLIDDLVGAVKVVLLEPLEDGLAEGSLVLFAERNGLGGVADPRAVVDLHQAIANVAQGLARLFQPGAVLVERADDPRDPRQRRQQGPQEDETAHQKDGLPHAFGLLEHIRENRQKKNKGESACDERDVPSVSPYLAVFPGVHRLSPKSRKPCCSHRSL